MYLFILLIIYLLLIQKKYLFNKCNIYYNKFETKKLFITQFKTYLFNF